MKPIIGIIEWPYEDKDGDKIFEILNDVVNCVIRAGGMPVGIFPTQTEDFVNTRLDDIKSMTADESDDLLSAVDRCDAIIKPGALKIYEYERLIHSYTVCKNMPYLGICAGMQIVSGYRSTINNIRIDENNVVNHHQKGYAHDVYPIKDTLLSRIVGTDKFPVYSKHKYHIADAGVNKVCAVAEDGIIEAIENPNCNYNLGLQWHPELAPSSDEITKKIFESLIEEAKVYSKIKR